MEVNEFKKVLQENFEKLIENQEVLFEFNVDKDELWNVYLDSFPPGANDIFRERREHDCSACRSFIKGIGNVCVIENNQIKTIWNFNTGEDIFRVVVKSLDKFLKTKEIAGIYLNDSKKIGVDVNYEKTENSVLKYEHLYLELPDKFHRKKDIPTLQGSYRDTKNVFKRSLDEITEESILTTLELISSNTLYKGQEWKSSLELFLKHKKAYEKLSNNERNLYTWKEVSNIGNVGKIRSHSIGTLLINLSDGMDLDSAVTKYEKIVAPENYKRPKAIFTKKMLKEAEKTVNELGYINSLARRYAVLEDISINNVLFSNKDSAKKMQGSIFDEMQSEITVDSKKFSKIEEISIENFITNVVPTAKEINVLFENKHSNQLVSLIAPKEKDSKVMFKWNNNFSWAYNGNVADSIKENVKKAGGNIDAVLRFSIQWNDEERDRNDLDAHCIEPDSNTIYYSNKKSYRTNGFLDIDIIDPEEGKPAVENITHTDLNKMLEGKYTFLVHNYSHRGGKGGFRAEIEFGGKIYSFDYRKELKSSEKVIVAEVYYNKKTGFTIKEKLPSNTSSKEIWNISTNQFIPVSTIMNSPNYWDAQKGIGHRHYFFMLKDCVNPESPNGFYNEYLKEELMKHKRVFEALGSRMKVEQVDNQLSGIGFSSTKRNEVIVKVKGQVERTLKIQF